MLEEIADIPQFYFEISIEQLQKLVERRMAKMDDEVKKRIEEAVNSKEIEEEANHIEYPFDYLYDRIKEIAGSPTLTEDEEDRLHRDLRDWWKNGNLYRQEPDTAWQLGDPDFWENN